jgi:hypothetical protein
VQSLSRVPFFKSQTLSLLRYLCKCRVFEPESERFSLERSGEDLNNFEPKRDPYLAISVP